VHEPLLVARQTAEGGGGIPRLPQQAWEPWRPGRKQIVTFVAHYPVSERALARVHRGEGGLGGDSGREEVLEDGPLGGQRVDIGAGRSGVAIAAKMVGPEAVHDDEEDVGSRGVHGSECSIRPRGSQDRVERAAIPFRLPVAAGWRPRRWANGIEVQRIARATREGPDHVEPRVGRSSVTLPRRPRRWRGPIRGRGRSLDRRRTRDGQ